MQGTWTDGMSRSATSTYRKTGNTLGMWVDFITDPRLNSVPCKHNTTGRGPNTIPDATKLKSQEAGESQRHR